MAKRLENRQGMQIGLDGVQLLGGRLHQGASVERVFCDLRAIGVFGACVMERAERSIMAINLELCAQAQAIIVKTHRVAAEMMLTDRPQSTT